MTPFGQELRRRREAAGMSLTGLAREVHYSKGYLSKIENGVKRPNPALARCCDAVLGAGGALAELAGEERRTSDAPGSSTATAPTAGPRPGPRPDAREHDDEGMWVMSHDQDGGSEFLVMNRRSLVAGGTVSLLGWNAALSSRASAAAREDVLGAMETMLAQAKLLGRSASPSLVLSVVIAQVQTLRGLARDAGPRDRGRLLRLTARHTEFAAWMAQESGNDRAAEWWIDQMHRHAREAGDAGLEAYAFIRRSSVTMYRADALSTVDLARRALATRSAPPWVHRSARLREAQGHAMAGDEVACRRALDSAAELREGQGRRPGTGAALGSTSVPDQHTLVTGWCLQDLGSPRQSAEILDRAVPLIPLSSGRAAARFGMRRALAHAASGEIDRACELARESLDLVAVVDSATVRTDVQRLARVLARWRTHPPVQRLRPDLLDVLRRDLP